MRHRSLNPLSAPSGPSALSVVDFARPCPTAVVAGLVARLSPPGDPEERERFSAIASALARRDGADVVSLLSLPPTGEGGVYAELPALVLIILAVEAFADHGWQLPEEEAILHAIRRQVRSELMRLPLALSGSWLVPHVPAEVTQAHVGALLLARKGDLVRPWMWPGLPEQGPFLLLGARASDHPAVADEHCRGATSFQQLVQRAGLIMEETMTINAVAG